MKEKKAVIWKESIYTNNFTCPICGSKLFDAAKNEFIEENTEFVPPDKDKVCCSKCGNPAAIITEAPSGFEPGLYGKWDEKKYGKLM